MPKRREIVLGITGSIAAYKAYDIINRLRENGYNITAVMTEEARHFISPLTLESLSGRGVVTGMFAPAQNYDPLHTALADKADLVLVAPATANLIGRIANGICDDILSCVILATAAPVLIAPAMNDKMYKNRAVEDNIKRLKKWGYKFVGPKAGHLACGYRAIGRLADTDEVIKGVKGALK